MTPLEQLERVAARVGWTLRWNSVREKAYPSLTLTTLEIRKGDVLITARGPAWVSHSSKVDEDNGAAKARDTIARLVLDALPRRGAGDPPTAHPEPQRGTL